MQTPSPASSVRCRLVRSDSGVLWTKSPRAHCTRYNSTKARPHHCILTKIIGQSVPAGKLHIDLLYHHHPGHLLTLCATPEPLVSMKRYARKPPAMDVPAVKVGEEQSARTVNHVVNCREPKRETYGDHIASSRGDLAQLSGP